MVDFHWWGSLCWVDPTNKILLIRLNAKRQGERRAGHSVRPLALATAGRLLGDIAGSGVLFARYLSMRAASVQLGLMPAQLFGLSQWSPTT
eukprot:scaffold506032_cov17-Prasinocladus_malaysianus.AAC.3